MRRFLQGGRGPEAPGGDGPAETAGLGHGERGAAPGPAPGNGPREPGCEVSAGAAHRTGNGPGTRSSTGMPGGEGFVEHGTGTRTASALPSRAEHREPGLAVAAATGQRHRYTHRDPPRALRVPTCGHSSARAAVENRRRDADHHPGHGSTLPAGSRSRSRSLSRSGSRSVSAPPLPVTRLTRAVRPPVTAVAPGVSRSADSTRSVEEPWASPAESGGLSR